MPRQRSLSLALICAAALLASCSGDGRNLRPPAEGHTAPPFQATTSAAPTSTTTSSDRPLLLLTPTMTPEGPMPATYTCDGAGISPPLSWTGVPEEAVSLAIVAEDINIDTTVRWFVANVDPGITGVAEGRLPQGVVGGGGEEARWLAPCPEPGAQHTMVFTLYALNEPVDLAGALTADEALSMIQLASAQQAAATTTVQRVSP